MYTPEYYFESVQDFVVEDRYQVCERLSYSGLEADLLTLQMKIDVFTHTLVSQLHQCSVLVVLAYHNYTNVRYLLYLRFTTTSMFSTCCSCVSQVQ